MNNTTKIRVGDKVRFINQKAHEDMPSCYPAVGTCGKVLRVIEHAEDDIELRIQWDMGSTSADDTWHCDHTSVEFVDSSYYKKEFVYKFGKLFANEGVRAHFEDRGVHSLEYDEEQQIVIIHFRGGRTRTINVAGDSVSAMAYEIIRYGLW